MTEKRKKRVFKTDDIKIKKVQKQEESFQLSLVTRWLCLILGFFVKHDLDRCSSGSVPVIFPNNENESIAWFLSLCL